MANRFALTAVLAAVLVLPLAAGADASTAKVVQVSRCAEPPEAEVVQAVAGRYVYEAWIGCGGIGFGRSVDGGTTFGPSRAVRGSVPAGKHTWDPAVAVASDGTVYVAYMVGPRRAGWRSAQPMQPAVAVSHDHGASFARASALPVPASRYGNFGDRPFIAVGRNGDLYVTWDYGPRRYKERIVCPPTSSCYLEGGEYNAVLQRSADGGKTWTQIDRISPGYPRGGVYSAPIVTDPDGSLDVLYWQHPTDPNTLSVAAGHEYFIRSTNGGGSWTKPVLVGAKAGTVGVKEWWIDGSLAVDTAGTLYAGWDTQRGARDSAWLAWSTDHGAHWSSPLPVASSRAEHLTEVAAAGRGNVYVGWQTIVPRKGYATLLRRYSVGHGWTGPAKQVSPSFGKPKTWPGDTFGLSAIGGTAFVSWGSATGHRKTSEIWFAKSKLPAR